MPNESLSKKKKSNQTLNKPNQKKNKPYRKTKHLTKTRT